MQPEEFNVTVCGLIGPAVGAGETATIECPVGGVRGRFLVVQLNTGDSGTGMLTLCEVTAREYSKNNHEFAVFTEPFYENGSTCSVTHSEGC